jgi:hypothetical protein
MGVVGPGGDYTAITPARIADSRADPGAPLQPVQEFTVDPRPDGSTVAVNVVSTGSGSPGWLQTYPCGSAVPTTSTLNFRSGQTIANSAMVKTGSSGNICVRSVARTHAVVDLTAVLGPSMFQSVAPRRLLDTRQP